MSWSGLMLESPHQVVLRQNEKPHTKKGLPRAIIFLNRPDEQNGKHQACMSWISRVVDRETQGRSRRSSLHSNDREGVEQDHETH